MIKIRHQIMVLSFLALISPVLAHACSCSGSGPLPCNQFLKESNAIFTGTVVDIENPPDPDPKAPQTGEARYTFAVSETFAGTSGGEVIVRSGRGGGDCSYHFRKGEQYLVYADRSHDRSLHAIICSRTQPMEGAEALLRQLRAAKAGKPIASLFGVLKRTQQPYDATMIPDYDQPISNTMVSLQSKTGKVFSTKTGDSGDYAFYDLPLDTYEISAALPRSLKIGQIILSGAPTSVPLHAQTCDEHDIDAVPQTQITGHLIGPDGKVLEGGVELFTTSNYEKYQNKRGWWEYAQGEKGFLFDHVAPGNYVLVFNNSGRVDTDAPYPRTFYPGVTDFSRAAEIHVTDNDLQINDDIHLTGGEENTEVKVRLEWPDRYQPRKDDVQFLFVHSDSGDSPFAHDMGNNLFSVMLLKRSTYTVEGGSTCTLNPMAQTNIVTIQGSEIFTAPIVLRFPEGVCAK
jgi:hypothetical protein